MARPKTMTKKKIINLPDDLVERIGDFWHTERLPNESEAMRQLIERGLTRDEIDDIADKAMRLLGRPHVLKALKEPERGRYEVLFRRWMDWQANHIVERLVDLEEGED